MKAKLLQDAEGNASSTRLQMILTTVFAFLIIGYQVYTTGTFGSIDAVILLTAAFAPKSIRDLSDLKINKKLTT